MNDLARIAELEAENKALKEAVRELAVLGRELPYIDLLELKDAIVERVLPNEKEKGNEEIGE
jgi:hypothetical protein